ncbi:glycoside hydrolase family protein [Insolitispirillum peregrinum]|uniref:Lysozyme n=1 Tax=Insolitispirillum peregrinum TaxID=80876 RepID=A0A1N7LGS6_9PROT|nr:glycoside hydrolase family protein [Insolitispirillum peregrinum]SIS73017.1 lysozyme [Insolitispirillum peregrinum]
MNLDLLKKELVRDEDERLKPYRCTAGKLTIGVGRNLDDVGLSVDESAYLLGNDIARVMAELDKALPWWRGLSEVRQRALANMAFNLGVPRLKGFARMLAALQAGQWDEAATQALASKWAVQVGDRAKRIATMIKEG